MPASGHAPWALACSEYLLALMAAFFCFFFVVGALLGFLKGILEGLLEGMHKGSIRDLGFRVLGVLALMRALGFLKG